MIQTDFTALVAFAKACDDLQRRGELLAWMVRSGMLEPVGHAGFTVKIIIPQGIAGVVPLEADGVTLAQAVDALHAQAVSRGLGQTPFRF